MAEIEEALTTYLLAQSGLIALIARRFFYEEVPQDTELPAVCVIKVSDVKDHLLTGQLNLESPMFQFTVYATTKLGARGVANQIKAALKDYVGTMSGIAVQHIRLVNEFSGLTKTADGTVREFTEDLEFSINFVHE